MAGLFETGELAIPLVSTQPAGGSHQQVMSPTLGQGYGNSTHPSPPPGRDGIQSGSTPTLAHGQTGGMGLNLWLREGHLEA